MDAPNPSIFPSTSSVAFPDEIFGIPSEPDQSWLFLGKSATNPARRQPVGLLLANIAHPPLIWVFVKIEMPEDAPEDPHSGAKGINEETSSLPTPPVRTLVFRREFAF